MIKSNEYTVGNFIAAMLTGVATEEIVEGLWLQDKQMKEGLTADQLIGMREQLDREGDNFSKPLTARVIIDVLEGRMQPLFIHGQNNQ